MHDFETDVDMTETSRQDMRWAVGERRTGSGTDRLNSSVGYKRSGDNREARRRAAGLVPAVRHGEVCERNAVIRGVVRSKRREDAFCSRGAAKELSPGRRGFASKPWE